MGVVGHEPLDLTRCKGKMLLMQKSRRTACVTFETAVFRRARCPDPGTAVQSLACSTRGIPQLQRWSQQPKFDAVIRVQRDGCDAFGSTRTPKWQKWWSWACSVFCRISVFTLPLSHLAPTRPAMTIGVSDAVAKGTHEHIVAIAGDIFARVTCQPAIGNSHQIKRHLPDLIRCASQFVAPECKALCA